MQTQVTNQNFETNTATTKSQSKSPFHQLAEARTPHRKIRIALPLPRRELCLTRRAMLAALREAEFNDWMESGGDYLDHMHQRVY